MALLDLIDRNQRGKGLSGIPYSAPGQSGRPPVLASVIVPTNPSGSAGRTGRTPAQVAQVALLLAWPCLEANLTFGLIDALTI
jgi:hypothetical protein